MKTTFATIAGVCLFVAGIGVGIAARPHAEPTTYRGKTAQQAASDLLDIARIQADDGSWELIAVGRVHYLGGDKAQGQAIFDRLLSGKHEDSDVFRIARVYQEAGDWEKARPLFDQYLARNDGDESSLAEVGAYYLMNGDRDTAEQLFDRALAIEPDMWVALTAAGAYLGVAPQP